MTHNMGTSSRKHDPMHHVTGIEGARDMDAESCWPAWCSHPGHVSASFYPSASRGVQATFQQWHSDSADSTGNEGPIKYNTDLML